MANINYKNLGLERTLNNTKFLWKDQEIEVMEYLPADFKYDVIMVTLQKSAEGGYYNPFKLDVYFHLNLIYMFTNVVFDDEDREDEFKLYDELKSTGFMDAFLGVFNSVEYKEMIEYIEQIADISQKYQISAASVLNTFVNDLPGQLENAQQIVDGFDKEKYQAVIDFAKAANNGKQPK